MIYAEIDRVLSALPDDVYDINEQLYDIYKNAQINKDSLDILYKLFSSDFAIRYLRYYTVKANVDTSILKEFQDNGYQSVNKNMDRQNFDDGMYEILFMPPESYFNKNIFYIKLPIISWTYNEVHSSIVDTFSEDMKKQREELINTNVVIPLKEFSKSNGIQTHAIIKYDHKDGNNLLVYYIQVAIPKIVYDKLCPLDNDAQKYYLFNIASNYFKRNGAETFYVNPLSNIKMNKQYKPEYTEVMLPNGVVIYCDWDRDNSKQFEAGLTKIYKQQQEYKITLDKMKEFIAKHDIQKNHLPEVIDKFLPNTTKSVREILLDMVDNKVGWDDAKMFDLADKNTIIRFDYDAEKILFLNSAKAFSIQNITGFKKVSDSLILDIFNTKTIHLLKKEALVLSGSKITTYPYVFEGNPLNDYTLIQVFENKDDAFKKLQEDLIDDLKVAFEHYQTDNSMAVMDKLVVQGQINVIVNNYDKINSLMQNSDSCIEANTTSNKDLPALPLIKKGTYLMPHQAISVTRSINRGCKIVANKIEPGGGKTIIDIMEMLALLQTGKIKRPIILMPGTLLDQWYAELKDFTNGKMNVIILDSSVWNTFDNTYGKGALEKLVHTDTTKVLLVSFDFISRTDVYTDYYAVEEVRKSRPQEFLRAYQPDWIAIDESQYLKNEYSGRSKGVQYINRDQIYANLSSGTMIHNRPEDIAGQYSIFDSGIFGTRENFNEIYGDLSPSSIRAFQERIHSAVIENNFGKEYWAHLLPQIREHVHVVDLTSEEKRIYRQILEPILEQLADEFEKIKQSREKLYAQLADADSDDVLEEIVSDLQGPFLSKFHRLSSYLVSPTSDVLGISLPKKPSAKLVKMDEIISKHLSSDKNKILVFCSTKQAARYLYENSKHKAKALYYDASHKKALRPFKDPKSDVKILIAVENSLREGQNLQIASRIIRMESVWTPGAVVQGNARIERPDHKNKYNREFVDIDWIICNNTMDVVKMALVYEKIIRKAQADNIRNIRNMDYDLDLVKLNPDALLDDNSMELYEEYFNKYTEYKEIEIENRAWYKEHGDKEFTYVESVEPNFKIDPLPIEPFTPRMTTPPFEMDYDLVKLETTDDSDGADVKKGDVIWGEAGFGIVQKLTIKKSTGEITKVTAKYNSGIFTIPVSKLFKVNEKVEEAKARIIEREDVKPTKKSDKAVEKTEKNKEESKKKKSEKKQKEEEPKEEIYVKKVMLNGQYGLACYDDLTSFGFKGQRFIWLKIPNKAWGAKWLQHMEKQIENGKLTIREDSMSILKRMIPKVTKGKYVGKKIPPSEIKQFNIIRRRKKKAPMIQIYPVLEDGDFYVVADLDTQPHARVLLKEKGRYKFRKGESPMYFYPSGPTKRKEKIKQLQKKFDVIEEE